MQSIVTYLILFLAVHSAYASSDTGDTTRHNNKLVFVHSFELGTTIKMGLTQSWINDHIDPVVKGQYNITLDYTKLIAVRISHGVALGNNLETGITVGTDLFVGPHEVRAFIPVMWYLHYTVPLKSRVLPMIEERLGYAFYIRRHDEDFQTTFKVLEGGLASETLIGVGFKTHKKVTPQVMIGYRLQHINSRMIFHSGASLVSQQGYNTGLPADVNITVNSIDNYLYLSLGLKF